MSKKKVYLVYQDCALCGDRGKVRKVEIEKASKKGVKVLKLSFASELAKDLIHQAVMEHKIGSMPFYTDGEKFGYHLADVIGTSKKKGKKRVTKKIKEQVEAEKEAEDGSIPEAE